MKRLTAGLLAAILLLTTVWVNPISAAAEEVNPDTSVTISSRTEASIEETVEEEETVSEESLGEESEEASEDDGEVSEETSLEEGSEETLENDEAESEDLDELGEDDASEDDEEASEEGEELSEDEATLEESAQKAKEGEEAELQATEDPLITLEYDSKKETFETYSKALARMKELGAKDFVLKATSYDSYHGQGSFEIEELPSNARSLTLTSLVDDHDGGWASFEISNVTGSCPLYIGTDTDIKKSEVSSVTTLERDESGIELRVHEAKIDCLTLADDSWVYAYGTVEEIGTVKGHGTFYSSMSSNDPSQFVIDKLDNGDGVLKLRWTRNTPYEGEVIATVKEGLSSVTETSPNMESGLVLTIEEKENGVKDIVLGPDPVQRVSLKITRRGETVLNTKGFSGYGALNAYLKSLDVEEYSDCDFYIKMGDGWDREKDTQYLYMPIIMPVKANSVTLEGNEKYFDENSGLLSEQKFYICLDNQETPQKLEYDIFVRDACAYVYVNNPSKYRSGNYSIQGLYFYGKEDVAAYEHSWTDLNILVNCSFDSLYVENSGKMTFNSKLDVKELTVGPNTILFSESKNDYDGNTSSYIKGYGNLTVEDKLNCEGPLYYNFSPEMNGTTIMNPGDVLFTFPKSDIPSSGFNKYVREGYSDDSSIYELEKADSSSLGLSYTSYRISLKKTYKWTLKYKTFVDGVEKEVSEVFYRSKDVMDKIYEIDSFERDYYIGIEPTGSVKSDTMKIEDYEDIPAKSVTIESSELQVFLDGLVDPSGEKDPTIKVVNSPNIIIGGCHLKSLDVENSTVYFDDGGVWNWHNQIETVTLDENSRLYGREGVITIDTLNMSKGSFTYYARYAPDNWRGFPELEIKKLNVPDNTVNLYIDCGRGFDNEGLEIIKIREGCDKVICQNADELKQDYGYAVQSYQTDDAMYAVLLKYVAPNYEYKVSFNANVPSGYKASGTMSQMTFRGEEEKVLSRNNFKATGLTFLGWNTKADGTGTFYEDQETVSCLAASATTVYLYAIWEEATYTITLETMGGSVSNNSLSYKTSSWDVELPTPEPAEGTRGFKFDGWFKSLTYKAAEKVTKVAHGSKGDYTFYAKWKPDTYVIFYYANDEAATGKMDPSEVSYYEDFTLSANKYKVPGKAFAGWKESYPIYDGPVYADKATVNNLGDFETNVVYLDAIWSNVYTVNFKSEGGRLATGEEVTTPYTGEYGKTYTLPTVVKEGYTFAGWYDDATGKKVTSIPKTQVGEVNVTARWTAHTATIAFNANGGKGSIKSVKTGYDAEGFALPANTITRAGYSFLGWATEKTGAVKYTYEGDGTIPQVDICNFIKEKGNGKTLTLYAVWKAENYTVNFNSNEEKDSIDDTAFTDAGFAVIGSGEERVVTYEFGKAYKLPSPVKNGFEFKGWYLDEKYKTKADIKKTTNGDVTLFAKWDAKYTVKFDKNDEAATGTVKDQAMTYNASKALTKNSYVKTGYVFMGWSTTSDGDVVYKDMEKITAPSAMEIGETNILTLYAVWENKFNVIFCTNGGAIDGSLLTAERGYTGEPSVDAETGVISGLEYTYGTVFTLPADAREVTRDGYEFKGWYTVPECTKGKEAKITNKLSGEVRLYAKWDAGYTVKFNKNTDAAVTGTVKDQAMTYAVNKALNANKYSRKDAGFIGWSTTSDGGVVYSDKEVLSGIDVKTLDDEAGNKVLNLYAVWKNRVDVTIDPAGGLLELDGEVTTEQKTKTINYGTAYTLPTVKRDGYTFGGWIDVTTNKAVKSLPKNQIKDVSVYAKWTPYTVNMKFDSSKGKGSIKAIKTGYDLAGEITLPENTFTKAGYVFTGWSETKDGAKVYDDKAEIDIRSKITKNGVTVTLYAVWEKVPYTITYENCAGVSEAEKAEWTTGYDVETAISQLPTPHRFGYSFGGWYSDEKLKTKVTAIKKGSTGDRVLYAKWVLNK